MSFGDPNTRILTSKMNYQSAAKYEERGDREVEC